MRERGSRGREESRWDYITTDHLPYGCYGNAVAELSVGVALRGPGSDAAWLPPQWLPHAGLTMPGWGAIVRPYGFTTLTAIPL